MIHVTPAGVPPHRRLGQRVGEHPARARAATIDPLAGRTARSVPALPPTGSDQLNARRGSGGHGSPPTVVLLCEERRAVQQAVARTMSAAPGVRRIECVANSEQLLAHYSRQPADLVLISTSSRAVASAAEITRRLLAAHSRADVLVLGTTRDASGIAAVMASGARGYLCWDTAREVITTLNAPTATPLAGSFGASEARLSERELHVLRGMSDGKNNLQIARELFLGENTVKTHARRIFRKLGVNDRAAAVAQGFRLGMVV